MRVYASREGAAAVSRQCRSRAGFNFNFQSSGFGQRPRAPPRRGRHHRGSRRLYLPKSSKHKDWSVGSRPYHACEKLPLNPDTGSGVFHAFYTAGTCEDKLDRVPRFPYPLVDWMTASTATAAGTLTLRYFKTDVSPGKPSSDDALKLAKKLGRTVLLLIKTNVPRSCPSNAGLRYARKDVVTHFFRRRSQNAFETWATSQLKVDVTFRFKCEGGRRVVLVPARPRRGVVNGP